MAGLTRVGNTCRASSFWDHREDGGIARELFSPCPTGLRGAEVAASAEAAEEDLEAEEDFEEKLKPFTFLSHLNRLLYYVCNVCAKYKILMDSFATSSFH